MKSISPRSRRALVAATLLGAASAALIAPAASASTSANGCVVLLSVTKSQYTTFVNVKNNCGSKQYYKIDIANHIDPTFTVAANATEKDAVGGAGLTVRKIYGP